MATQKAGRIRCWNASHVMPQSPWSRASTTSIPVGPVGAFWAATSPLAGSQCRSPLRTSTARRARRKAGTEAPLNISTRKTLAPRHRPAEARPRAKPEHESQYQRRQRELEGGRQVRGEVGRHRSTGPQRAAQIAVEQPADVVEVLIDDGLVVAEDRRFLGDGGLRGVRAQVGVDGIRMAELLQAEDDRRQDEEDHDHRRRAASPGRCRRLLMRSALWRPRWRRRTGWRPEPAGTRRSPA